MFWLPKLTVGAAHWRLPLSESTAAAIVALLFPDPNDASPEAFRIAVATDPGLALWLACKFPRDQNPCGVGDLAEWFRQDVVSHLAWHSDFADSGADSNGDSGNGDSGNGDSGNGDSGNGDSGNGHFGNWDSGNWDSGNWSVLTDRSRAVAQRTVQPTSESPQTPLAELIGLLHLSPDLLSLCGPTIQLGSTDNGPNCLPGWLTDAIGQLRRTDASDTIYQVVRQAMEECERHQPTEGPLGPDTSTPTLAAMLPQMAQTLARLKALEGEFAASLESAKLDAMRELAYGASHEINNPLANISTRAQALLIGETDPERRRRLATINSQAFRAHEMISDIMLFAKPPQIDSTSVNLAEMTDEILSELAEDAKEQGTELRYELPDKQIAVLADREHLAVALKALVRNSLEAIAIGGYVELTARLISDQSSGRSQVEIVVRDNGPGISADARSSMFNPFYSGREAGRGLGLGLSKCWRIITLHGGSISLDDSYSDGARFVIYLPVGAVHSVDPEFAANG